MASLGSFSAELQAYTADAEPTTFDFYGQTFTVFGRVPAITELTLTATLAGKVSNFDGDVALYEALRYALTRPEQVRDGQRVAADTSQWRDFARLAAERQAPDELLTEIVFRLLGWQIGRPTGQRSDSASGSLPTSTSSPTTASDSPDSPTPDLA